MRMPRCCLSTRRSTRTWSSFATSRCHTACCPPLATSNEQCCMTPGGGRRSHCDLIKMGNAAAAEPAAVAPAAPINNESSSISTHVYFKPSHGNSCVNCSSKSRWCASIPLPITQPPSDHPGNTVYPLFACPYTRACALLT